MGSKGTSQSIKIYHELKIRPTTNAKAMPEMDLKREILGWLIFWGAIKYFSLRRTTKRVIHSGLTQPGFKRYDAKTSWSILLYTKEPKIGSTRRPRTTKRMIHYGVIKTNIEKYDRSLWGWLLGFGYPG